MPLGLLAPGAGQILPHMPQLETLTEVSMHMFEQTVRRGLVTVQVPEAQDWQPPVALQVVPQQRPAAQMLLVHSVATVHTMPFPFLGVQVLPEQ